MAWELSGITFQGTPLASLADVAALPDDLRKLLRQVNGFVAFFGALHVRGWCDQPSWHSLSEVTRGPMSLATVYEQVRAEDVPFGQDALGNQFLLIQDGKL